MAKSLKNIFMGNGNSNTNLQDKDKTIHNDLKDVNEMPQLFIPENMDSRISKFQKEYLKDELSEFEGIGVNNVDISGNYLYDSGDKIEISAFIRNGLNVPINFENVPVILIDDKNNKLANQEFDLREIGDIPARSAIPYKFYFEKKNLMVEKIEKDNWKIAFGIEINAVESVEVEYEDLPEQLSEVQKKQFNEFLKGLPMLPHGALSIATYSINILENGDMSLIFVLRNGSDKILNIEKLPVTVIDGRGSKVAEGDFRLNDFTVNARKANVYNFVFPHDTLLSQEIDLSSWKVMFKQIG